jgi:type IV secretion system protein VirB10
VTEKAKPEWESPGGLDLNPRPPKPVRISRRAAGLLIGLGVAVLMLFAYGGYQRQQRQVAALAEGETRKNVAPAVAAGADISKDIPTRNLLTSPGRQDAGLLQPPTGANLVPANGAAGGADRVVVRQPSPVQPAPPPQTIKEPSPEERRVLAAYEREQQAIAAPTALRDGFATSATSATAPRAESNDGSQLAQLLAAVGRSGNGGNPVSPELIRSLVGSRGANSGAQDFTEQNQQMQKEEFLSKARGTQSANYLKSTRNPALSPYEIKAGWEIPAVMEQVLNSDLPGELKALVTSNVYDTATGQYVLIPQGSRLVGIYSSQVGYGQDGVQVIWHRVIFPDASSLDLGGMAGQDSRGQSGLRHKVDRHYKRLIGFAVLTSLFAAASDLATSRNRSMLSYPSRGEVFGAAIGREATELGAQVTRRNLNVQPTIRVPVGYKFNVRVNRDILFETPYDTE